MFIDLRLYCYFLSILTPGIGHQGGCTGRCAGLTVRMYVAGLGLSVLGMIGIGLQYDCVSDYRIAWKLGVVHSCCIFPRKLLPWLRVILIINIILYQLFIQI